MYSSISDWKQPFSKAVIITLILSACADGLTTSPATHIPPSAAADLAYEPPTTSSPVDLPASTPIPSMTPEPTLVPAMWASPFPGVFDGDFLFGMEIKDCDLPCWGTLTPGESHLDDVQYAFENVLGFSMGGDIRTLPLPEINTFPLPSDEKVTIAYNSKALMTLTLDTKSGSLELITFQKFAGIDPDFALRKIINDLGAPDVIRIHFQEAQAGFAFVEIQLLYSQGIMFYYKGSATQFQASNDDPLMARTCENFPMSRIVIALMEPFRDDLLGLSSPQEHVINEILNPYSQLHSLETVTGYTPEQFIEELATDPALCLYGQIRP